MSAPLRRGAVTVLCLAGAEALRHVAAPGIATDAAWTGPTVSLGALGIVSFLQAWILVEFVAFAIPSLRPLRESRDGRRTLAQVATAVGLCGVGVQAISVFIGLAAGTGLSGDPVLHTQGLLANGVLITSFVAGSAAIWALAGVVQRFGLGGGFSLLVAWSLLMPEWEGLSDALRNTADHLVLAGVLLGVGLAVTVQRLLPVWRGLSEGGRPRIPLPLSGFVPLPQAVALLWLGPTLAAFGLVIPWPQGGWPFFGSFVVVALVLTVVWGRLMHSRSALARYGLTRTAAHERTSLVLVGGVAAVAALLWSWEVFISLASLLTFTAVAWDLRAEWRFRNAHGELAVTEQLHRLYAAPAAHTALSAAGIPAHVRSVAHRSTLMALAPWLPLDVLVPCDRYVEARDLLLRARLAREGESA